MLVSEFVALSAAQDMALSMSYKTRMMGVPIDGK